MLNHRKHTSISPPLTRLIYYDCFMAFATLHSAIYVNFKQYTTNSCRCTHTEKFNANYMHELNEP